MMLKYVLSLNTALLGALAGWHSMPSATAAEEPITIEHYQDLRDRMHHDMMIDGLDLDRGDVAGGIQLVCAACGRDNGYDRGADKNHAGNRSRGGTVDLTPWHRKQFERSITNYERQHGIGIRSWQYHRDNYNAGFWGGRRSPNGEWSGRGW